MSPEMVRLLLRYVKGEEDKILWCGNNCELVGLESDLYSLGILVIEMLTGKVPGGYLDPSSLMDKEVKIDKLT
jgi:serine/threonine protein kinase